MKTKTSIKIFLIPAIFFSVFFIFGNEAKAAEYYVSPTGNDSNSGSSSAPFKTIQHAADVVNAGDTVIVKDGTYTDTDGDKKIIRVERKNGTADNWITFKAENKWGAVLDGQQQFGSGITVSEANYVRFEDFEIQNIGTGVIAALNHDVYFYRLHIHDIGNFITCVKPPQAYEWAFEAFLLDSTSYNITVDSSVIHDIGRNPCAFFQWTDYNHDHGIYAACDNCSIINNIFYSVARGWALHITGGNNWTIVNNTFYGSNPYETGPIILVTQVDAINNAKVENNIAYHLPVSSGYYSLSSYCLVDLWLHGTASGIEMNNNLVYKNDKNDPIAKLYRQVYGTEAQWSESNNILNQDPKFVNVTNKDFHLQAGSPAINTGLDASSYMTRDMDGNARPQGIAYDIGAYEYVSGQPADTTPPASPTGLVVN